MASAAPLEKVIEEAACSICLEYLTEPVTIDCGHNFCRACITQYSEQREPESGTKMMGSKFYGLIEGKLQHNRQLADIVENIKQLGLKSGNAQKENLCERHEEKLQLFCEEDGEAICVVCRMSRAHRVYTVVSIQEAAQHYKMRITAALDDSKSERPKRRTAIVSRELSRYNIDIAALSETRYADEGRLREEVGSYTFFWKEKPASGRRINGVGFAIKNLLVNCLTELPVGINECLMTLHIQLVNKSFATIISACAPTLDAEEEQKESFYTDLDKILSSIPKTDKIILLEDFNSRVG
ncbi:tripartite motif-containing protein 5-like [Terrapene carolina triunguis]|uniref:tripartite motif-containing protein 5-like n=1 Tax=Terrapene triunguis TaxID=2587831 RepID=UPI0011566761|nr:tripartite motif-containing protein 5-like [Terrapene carolina triunguis]